VTTAPGASRAGDRGSGSLWLLSVGLATVALAGLVAAIGSVLVARHRAQSAADLGALAGAGRVVEGPDAACTRAGQLVTANGAWLAGCRIDGLDVTIEAGSGAARAWAPARPAPSTGKAQPREDQLY
jgi:secretion/DNA translocation related TadE-like protein